MESKEIKNFLGIEVLTPLEEAEIVGGNRLEQQQQQQQLILAPGRPRRTILV
ncbi:hypothetical protein [Riemerella columbina]|uniref:hypothetical protein n=1 Tax=Riemerella columbina TaxID=103810 RepID=UPI000374BC7F|nr:hypothetical protein [Riemerella columbina]